mmetsp:Transcript_18951/g.34305  ORF Transcript_18951/g.34305 Transcript_18951/m.34305 type:complete len:226 (+) Transcript_18951:5515-6192(+)
MLSEVNIELLMARPKFKPHKPKKDDGPRFDNEKRLITELEAMKHLCKMYETDALQARTMIDDAYQKTLKVKEKRKVEKEKHEDNLKEIEITVKAEFESEKKKNLVFRADALTELSLREALNIRQQEMIKALQEELKSAKMILKSTRLRHKFLDSLKTGMEEVPEALGHRSRLRRSSRMPKAVSTLPRLERSMIEGLPTSDSPILKHLNHSPEALTKASSQFSSFS